MLHYLAVLLQVPRLDVEDGLGVLSGEYHKKYLNLKNTRLKTVVQTLYVIKAIVQRLCPSPSTWLENVARVLD